MKTEVLTRGLNQTADSLEDKLNALTIRPSSLYRKDTQQEAGIPQAANGIAKVIQTVLFDAADANQKVSQCMFYIGYNDSGSERDVYQEAAIGIAEFTNGESLKHMSSEQTDAIYKELLEVIKRCNYDIDDPASITAQFCVLLGRRFREYVEDTVQIEILASKGLSKND